MIIILCKWELFKGSNNMTSKELMSHRHRHLIAKPERLPSRQVIIIKKTSNVYTIFSVAITVHMMSIHDDDDVTPTHLFISSQPYYWITLQKSDMMGRDARHSLKGVLMLPHMTKREKERETLFFSDQNLTQNSYKLNYCLIECVLSFLAGVTLSHPLLMDRQQKRDKISLFLSDH